MADWTSIPDAALAEKAPIRSVDVLALRDNVPAAMEGADGAPRIRARAFDAPLVAGTVTRFLDTEEYVNTLTSFRAVFHYSFSQAGTVQVRFEHARQSNTGSSNRSNVRVLVDNVPILDVNNNQGGMVQREVTATIVYNGVLRIEHRLDGSASSSRIQNIELRTSGGVVWLWPKGMRFPQ